MRPKYVVKSWPMTTQEHTAAHDAADEPDQHNTTPKDYPSAPQGAKKQAHDNAQYREHKGHSNHHAPMAADFRRQFWSSLALAVRI